MDQQALEDVASTAQVQASHSAGVIHVGEGPFDEFGPAVLQPLATRASEATSVRIHRGLGFFLVLPIASSTIGLRDTVGMNRLFCFDRLRFPMPIRSAPRFGSSIHPS